MTPSKALELVTSYAALTRSIKECAPEIGAHLDQCSGISGMRGKLQEDGYSYVKEPELDEKNRDLDLHLTQWYTPYEGGNEWSGPYLIWDAVGEDHGKECSHCYAAHLAIQKRKELKKQLSIVKRSMSRIKS